MLGRSALLAATNVVDYGNWLGNYSDVSLLLRNGTPLLVPFDESPTPKTITSVGNASATTAIARWNQGSGGSSLAFDGSGDYLKAPDSNDFLFGTGDFTIECWIYKTATTAVSTILANLVDPSLAASDIWIYVNSNNAIVTSNWGAIYSTSASHVVSDNSWFHIAWTRLGTTARIFVNGQVVSTYTLSANINRNTGPTIGAYGASVYPFSGYIDDLRITKGIARYETGTGANAGKMVFAGTNDLALPTTELPANITDDPNWNNVSLLLRNGTQQLLPFDESPTPKSITAVGNASVSTAVARWNQGSGGSSLAFDGTDDRLTFASSNDFAFGTGEFTIEVWMFSQDVSNAQRGLVQISDATGGLSGTFTNSVMIYQGSNGVVTQNGGFTAGINGAFMPTNVSLSTNVWYHIALTRVGSTFRLFIQGDLVGTLTSTVNLTSSNLVVGGFIGTSNLYNGLLDDLRITKGIARYVEGTGTNAGKMVFAGTNDLADPNTFGEFQTNSGPNPDPSYNSVSLLLRNGTPLLVPFDESPTPKTITRVGDATISTTIFKYGTSSLYLDGTGDVFTVPPSAAFAPGTGDFTIEAWVYVQRSTNGIVFNQAVSGTNYFVFETVSTTALLTMTPSGGGSAILGPSGFNMLNTWRHIAAVRQSGVVRVFIDGVSGTPTANGMDLSNTTFVPTIGAYTHNYGQNVYQGYIDDLRYTKGIARYTSNFTPPTAELPANITNDPSYNSVSLLLRNGALARTIEVAPLKGRA